MDKGDCFSCGRKIQKTLTSTCIYCGEPLPESQLFSEEEIKQIQKEKNARDMARAKHNDSNRADFSPYSSPESPCDFDLSW
ncbi:hypothetical protein [Hahella ganghwensis]|uniref:hypothetical protein n=1 Tax=Hahella ganghwensis TaxID=286420 RepID=UPI00036FE471|nr:hypothetical protein [Hahella ganghwensis]